jgi:hypothetical protein
LQVKKKKKTGWHIFGEEHFVSGIQKNNLLPPPHPTPPHPTPLHHFPPQFLFFSAGWNIVAREIPSEGASGNKQKLR